MPRFFGKSVCRQQPQSLARIRPAHSLAAGLVGWFGPSTATAQRAGSPVLKNGVDGIGFTNPVFGTYWQASPTSLVSQHPTWTIMAVVNGTQSAFGSNGITLYAERPNGTQIVKLQMSFTGAPNAALTVRDLSNNLVNFAGTSDVCASPGSRVIIGTRRASNNHRLYVDGRLEASETTTNINGVFGASDAQIGQDPQDNTTAMTQASAPLILLWNRSLSDAEIQAISLNPWQVFRASDRVWLVPQDAASPDVTAALTGVEGTGQVGDLQEITDTALTGNGAAGSVGTLTPTESFALTGTAATGGVGTLVPGEAFALTGVEGTSAVGNVSAGADVTASLTGNEATTGLGNLAADTATPLTGVEGTSQVGSVTAGNDVTAALTGTAATGSVGTLIPEEALALTGAAAAGQVGSVVPTVTVVVDLSGVEATGNVGSVSAGSDVTASLSGVTAAGQVGALSPSILVDRVLTGVEALAAFGTLVPGIALGLTGVQATGQVGTLSTDVPPTRWNYGTIGPEYRVATISGESRTWRMTP